MENVPNPIPKITRKRKVKEAETEDSDFTTTTPKRASRVRATKVIASDGVGGTSTGAGGISVGNGKLDSGIDSEEEGLVERYRHIWTGPLEDYRLEREENRRRVEIGFRESELTRSYLTALRVEEMTSKRLDGVKGGEVSEGVGPRAGSFGREISVITTGSNGTTEEEIRLKKEVEREERLRKQREAAKKKREEEKIKKERDEGIRKSKLEEIKLKKVQESQRRDLLTEEERVAEDLIISERLLLQSAARAKQIAEGMAGVESIERGARKRKRPEGFNGDLSSSFGEFGDVYGDLEEGDDYGPNGNTSLKKSVKRKGKKKGREEAEGLYSTGTMDPYGQGLLDSGMEEDEEEGEGDSRFGSRFGSEFDELEEENGGEDFSISVGNGKRKVEEVEALERKVWSQIAKRDIPRAVRVAAQSTASRQVFNKRLSSVVAREARRGSVRTKGAKDVQTRAKRVMREMLLFTKTNEKKERENRKIAEKAAVEKVKKEEDMREAKRAARKLNFLITQTELYSHFIGNKVKTSEAEESADTAGSTEAKPQQSASFLAAVAATDAPTTTELKELDFDADDETNVIQHARRNAQAAVDAAKNAATAFDEAASTGMNLDNEDLNFQNPSGMDGVQVAQPKLLTCTLKDYQLKGLNWLASLYEQGINGILADEMGLGKTVQSISLMAYLAEVHNIWGPFLVIAPSSTLHNWQQEISRFVPSLKALPYWGNTKDRTVLRKFWNRKSLRYDKDAPFHILVTSYQLAVQDEKYFQGVKWQYMVLDEAQAIKSSTSTRWKTLLGFKCRNRLLLTGTPIQNSMHELWALLHFIMPSLFDSHDEFSEWFSKDIEGNTDKNAAMNAQQLQRLHMILKPFMLRRIKKNVQNELGEKIEIDVYCDLTPRQKVMYRTLRENISITDLVSRSSSLNEDEGAKRLMNLIMQFRKVCNHPELFERADVTAPLAFVSFNRTANLVRDPEILEVPYSTRSNIEYVIPKQLYREGMVGVVGENSRKGSDTLYLDRLFNIWTPSYIQKSLEKDSTFAFSRMLQLSPSEISEAVKSHGIKRIAYGLKRLNTNLSRAESSIDGIASKSLSVTPTIPHDPAWKALGLVPLLEIQANYQSTSRLARSDARFFMDKVVAPSINSFCADPSFAHDQQVQRFDPFFSKAIFGLPISAENSSRDIELYERNLPGLSPLGALALSRPTQLPFPPMQVPQLKKLILDSGKLAKLDTLLQELKLGGHRVLLYFQMTRMIDLMEEYLGFRQYRYLRLDGSSTMTERRDMVMDWQTKPELFIFLLSTRAGGLGINLTAADTVIFYDSDWNPSNDLQAMDRAHRLGQTKQVTVYRLITKDTVDERIVHLARNKKLVQDAVVGSSSATPIDPATAGAKSNEVMSLLLGPDELEEGLRRAEARRRRAEEKAIEDGKKGAKTREENKKSRDAKALFDREEEERKRKAGGSWTTAADDEDAFSFFAETKITPIDDEDDVPVTRADTPVDVPAAPVKRKRRSREEMELARANGEPTRKRKPKGE